MSPSGRTSVTVAEAMWKKAPVVASAVGGIRDQIDDGALAGRGPQRGRRLDLRILHRRAVQGGQVALRVQRGLAAGAGCGDRLLVGVVDQVAGGGLDLIGPGRVGAAPRGSRSSRR